MIVEQVKAVGDVQQQRLGGDLLLLAMLSGLGPGRILILKKSTVSGQAIKEPC
jgi:hypothetical protein